MYKIDELEGRFYVTPTAAHVLQVFDRFSFPYDTNWEIYRRFNYPAEDFFKYIISTYNAKVVFQFEFPWVSFYFTKYSEAEFFKKELEERLNAA